MECLTWAEFETVLDVCLIAAAALTSQNLSPSIGRIHEERMTDMLHVGTYLMSTACLKNALHQGGIAETFQYLIMGNGSLAYSTVRIEHLHAKTVLGVAAYIAFDSSLVLNDISPYQSIIAAMGGLVEELFSKSRLGIWCLCHYQQSGSILVDTMHKPHLWIVRVEILHVFHVPSHCIDERTGKVACTWMNHHASLLVDHHQCIVLVHDIQRNVLCHNTGIMLGTVEHQGDDIIGSHLIVALYGFSVDMNKTSISSILYAVTALIGILLGEELVYTHRCLTGIHLYLPMLVKRAVASIHHFRLVQQFYIVVVIIFYHIRLLHYFVLIMTVRMRRRRLARLCSRDYLEIVHSIVFDLTTSFQQFMAVTHGVNHLYRIACITSAVSHLYDEHIVYRDFVASHYMSALYQDAVHPVFLTRNVLRRAQLEAHSRKLGHGLAQGAVVDDIRDGDNRRMSRVDGDINHVARLHLLAWRRALLQHAVGREVLHISRIRNHHRQTGILEDTLSISKTLMPHVRNGDGFSMMSIKVDAKPDTHTQQDHHQSHGGKVSPQILTLELIYKLG